MSDRCAAQTAGSGVVPALRVPPRSAPSARGRGGQNQNASRTFARAAAGRLASTFYVRWVRHESRDARVKKHHIQCGVGWISPLVCRIDIL